MSDNFIRTGDVVQLGGGGCLMTVSRVGQRVVEARPIACIWFDDDGQLKSGDFVIESLRRVIVDDRPLAIAP